MADYTANKPITKIVYSFKDASVPPQYHRSYTITITRKEANIIVDSYGDILAKATIDIPAQTIDDLLRYIEIYQIKKKNHRSDITIGVGGSSKSLTIYSGEDVILNGMVYQFGGHLEGNLSGDIDSFTKKIEDLIPDLTNLLK